MPPPKKKPKQTRKNSKQMQQHRINEKQRRERKKWAHKRATVLYNQEKHKVKGLSARKVSKLIEKETGVYIGERCIQRYVEKGCAGDSPAKLGKAGEIPKDIFSNLVGAFESFVRINQLNGKGAENSQRKLAIRVNGVMKKETKTLSKQLLNRLLAETAIDLLATKGRNVEERRILWTTYRNLKSWFDNWCRDLVELGFAHKDESGEIIIPDDQLARIVNIDETCLVLDGSKAGRGGCPEVYFYDASLPELGRAAAKSSLSTTMIGGSTAAGEAIPPHFQFSTTAQTSDNMRLQCKLIEFMPSVIGKFAYEEEKEFPVTFGMNEKGGMDEVEFEKYIMGSIVPLFLDVEDVAGKLVMTKVDSGPGRLNPQLLARLRLLGVVLYPGVPNTTAVTQETDKNYGPFKVVFTCNLDDVTQYRINKNISSSIQPWLVGLLVFGGQDPASGFHVADSAFDAGFNMDQNLKSWAKVGAAPVTRKCLESNQVCREFGDGDGEHDQVMLHIQSQNDMCTYFLTQRGFDGDQLKAKVSKKSYSY